MTTSKILLHTSLFMVALASVVSCKKEISQPENHDPTVGVVSLIKNVGEIRPSKYVFVEILQQADAIDTAASFGLSVFGNFEDERTGALLNAGKIIINDSIVVTSGPGNSYEYRLANTAMHLPHDYPGKSISVQVTGSNTVDSLKRKLYIPQPIFLYQLYKSIATISNNRSYNLSWNADAQNMFGKVLIRVDYFKGLSQSNNPANPPAVDGLTYTVNDNGGFVIPAVELQRFPVSSYISITISRATDNLWQTPGGHIEYIAVTNAYTAPILVKN
jgi:hypothetical protein